MALVSLKLGTTAFGGPAAHIAMLRDEVVTRRQWMTDHHFLDMLAATNLIPGPNSTEMVMHAGLLRAGKRGLVAGGVLFIAPAALLTLLFAWLYVEYGQTPQLASILNGITPVVIAVIVQAVWGLGRSITPRPLLLATAVTAGVLAYVGVNELLVLIGSGVVIALMEGWRGRSATGLVALLPAPPLISPHLPAYLTMMAAGLEPYAPGRLFWEFLKIGSTLYGSGYVLISFLQQDFVEHLGWLTEQQLLDAVAIGQFTPGPVFSTATFVGYLVGGFGGAALATVAIFLPAFLLVSVSQSLLRRLRASRWTSGFLDGVSAAAVGLMATVALVLAQAELTTPLAISLALAAALALLAFRLNSAVVIVLGGVCGFVAGMAGA
ncbi:MAG: chromate efflux transporter [Thermomicrobiales bacterium]